MKYINKPIIDTTFDLIKNDFPIKVILVKQPNQTYVCFLKDGNEFLGMFKTTKQIGKVIRNNNTVMNFFIKFSKELEYRGLEIDDINILWAEFHARAFNSITQVKNFVEVK
jgi:hypothetical protein